MSHPEGASFIPLILENFLFIFYLVAAGTGVLGDFLLSRRVLLVHRTTRSGPESEVSGLESACPCSPRQGVVSASDTRWRQRNILAAPGAVAAGENSPGRRGILGVSTQGQAGHLSTHCPPIKRTTPLWGKAWYCPAWRWESCSIWC